MEKKRSFEAFALGATFLLIVILGTVFFFKPWLPELASDRGEIDKLFYVTLWITGIVFIIVQGLIGYFIWRYSKEKSEKALHYSHDTRLEVTWTVLTAVFLFALAGWGMKIWNGTMLQPPPPNAVAVEAIGQQFAWTFRYPSPNGMFARIDPKLISYQNPAGLDPKDENSKGNVLSKNDLYIPVNVPVLVRIRAMDVLHSFFLPNFRVKQDAVPGMTVSTWFTPTKVGDYEIACAQLCGLGHYTMGGMLHVMKMEDYQKKIESMRKIKVGIDMKFVGLKGNSP